MKRTIHGVFVVSMLLLCAFGQASAQSNWDFFGQQPTVSATEDLAGYNTRGRSVQEFLTPEGRFDLQKARVAGYQGPINLSGFAVRMDPTSGQPVIHPSDATAPADHPDDIYWEPGQGVPGTDGDVYALTMYGGRLIVGGDFQVAGDVIAHYIAAWDGTSWSALGSGLNGEVWALAVYDNQLIAGGEFTTAGGVSANYIAAWDGISWSCLGSGMNYWVVDLAVYDNRLIAGEGFGTAGGIPASGIAAWDGAAWSALGSGMNYYVYTLTVYNDKLIAGGYFTTAGGVSAKYIASWDGVSWSALGSGMNSYVMALAIYDSKLIAGGNFTTAGAVSANYIAAWDGTSWSGLGSGMDYWVADLAVYDSKLIAGGAFETPGGVSAKYIAAWDGNSWSALGSEMTEYGYVYSLAVHNNQLIVGGGFTTAGGVSANYIAAWNGISWSTLGSGMNDWVYALATYSNKLIAGGSFTTAGGKVSAYIAVWNPYLTAVEMSGFAATAGDRIVTLSWETRSELDNLGFEIYRRVQDSPFVKINTERISGGGTSEIGGTYQYVDRGLTNGTTYCYRIASVDFDGSLHMYEQLVFATPTEMLPLTFALSQNYPNPFNPSTEIRYQIPQDSHVSLKIYNVMGQEVKTLVEADLQAGSYAVTWDGRDISGHEMVSGVYFCRLKGGGFDKSIKMILLK